MLEARRWIAQGREVFNLLGDLHCTLCDDRAAEGMVACLNEDMLAGLEQTWMSARVFRDDPPWRRAVHFVGFRGEEWWSAVRVFGLPDFVHRYVDNRLLHGGEVSPGDLVVYANGAEKKFNEYSCNDSQHFWGAGMSGILDTSRAIVVVFLRIECYKSLIVKREQYS